MEIALVSDYSHNDINKNIKIPILLINDYFKTAHGGAIVFKDNQILKQLKMGIVGVLTYNINK